MQKIILGDCFEKLKNLEKNSIDSVVTDPPYGLSFMGKKWDYDVPSVDIWREVLRVLKPGGHVLSFCGTRTYHRMVVKMEDAGFEIRDQIQWIYGSGFPKSMDVSKAIDKAAGAEREVLEFKDVGPDMRSGCFENAEGRMIAAITAPATNLAKQWSGWGTALKPANEPICLARKPLEGTVAANVEKWGVGGLNIDGARIGAEQVESGRSGQKECASESFGKKLMSTEKQFVQGRWPANVIFDEEAAAILDEQSGILKTGGAGKHGDNYKGNVTNFGGIRAPQLTAGDSGGASRFFYVAKASKRERNVGLEGMPLKTNDTHNNPSRMVGASAAKAKAEMDTSGTAGNQNFHPTVKPIKLMEYLVKMITPPNGLVLDPFAGSGSTGVAAVALGFDFIGIEREPAYVEIAEKRIQNSLMQTTTREMAQN